MARVYTVTFEKVSVSAVQDLFQIKGAANKVLRILSFEVDDVDTAAAPANQNLALRAQYLPATVTDGSGGSSPTPRVISPGDAAASFTAKANNTTVATTDATAITQWEGGQNVFASGPIDCRSWKQVPEIPPSTSWVLKLLTAPNGALLLSGTVIVEELG